MDRETRSLLILYANMWRYLEHTERLLQVKGRKGIDTISEKTYRIRELLGDVVLILVNTGMRLCTGILKLKWNNLRVVEQDGKKSIKFSLPHTKIKVQRIVIGYEPRQKEATLKGRLNERAQRSMISLYFQPRPVYGLPA